MKKIDLAQTISILANLGVIAGIVFLAVEIGQNQAALEEQNTLTRLSGRDAALEHNAGFRQLLLENPALLQTWEKVRAGDALTPLERTQFELLCMDRVYINLNVYDRFDALGQEQERDAMAGLIAGSISSSAADRGCWEHLRVALVNQGFNRFVNSVDSMAR